MDRKSSVLLGLEEKQKQLEAEIQEDLNKSLIKLKTDFEWQKSALIENYRQSSDLEILKLIKNILIKKRIDIRHKINEKQLDLINGVINDFQSSFNDKPKKAYENFYHQSLSKLIQRYVRSEDSIIIHILPEDETFIDLDQENITILKDLRSSNLGGYIIEIPQRKIVINNTLMKRLENSKRSLQKEYAFQLFNSIPLPKWDDERIIENLMNIGVETSETSIKS